MTCPGTPYLVQRGDTLWDLAAAHLGSPWQWPRIYTFNNRGSVNRCGIRRITDPDLIYAGETMGPRRNRPGPRGAPHLRDEPRP